MADSGIATSTVTSVLQNSNSADLRNMVPGTDDMINVRDSIMGNQSLMNEYVAGLNQQIGEDLINTVSGHNPLSIFKKPARSLGSATRETMMKLIPAKQYTTQGGANEIFYAADPSIDTAYHREQRANYYEVPINRDLLRDSFTSDEAMNTLVKSILESMLNSDAFVEYASLLNKITDAFRSNNLTSISIGDYNTDDDDVGLLGKTGKRIMRHILKDTRNAKFLTTSNMRHVLNNSTNDGLVLLLSNDLASYLDVSFFTSQINKDPVNKQIVKTVILPNGFMDHSRADGSDNIVAALVDINFLNYSDFSKFTTVTTDTLSGNLIYRYIIRQIQFVSPFNTCLFYTIDQVNGFGDLRADRWIYNLKAHYNADHVTKSTEPVTVKLSLFSNGKPTGSDRTWKVTAENYAKVNEGDGSAFADQLIVTENTDLEKDAEKGVYFTVDLNPNATVKARGGDQYMISFKAQAQTADGKSDDTTIPPVKTSIIVNVTTLLSGGNYDMENLALGGMNQVFQFNLKDPILGLFLKEELNICIS